MSEPSVERGSLTRTLWLSMWALSAALIGQDATALERVLIMGKVRVLRPGQAMTMDYWPDRINFMIDGDNRIERITCG